MHRDWTVEDWKKVIWTDETKIYRYYSDGITWVYRQEGVSLQKKDFLGTLKHGGGSIIVWGCFGWQGVGLSCKIEGNMDALKYVAILQQYYLSSLKNLGRNNRNSIFQQDNDPKHTSKKASEWIPDNIKTKLPWPSQSPDLNPIEHLWQICKLRLNRYDRAPSSINELTERFNNVWLNIEKETCQKLITSMPRRIEAVIKVKGG